MAKYRVLAKCYIGNTIREVGEVVEYDGKPVERLRLLNDRNHTHHAVVEWIVADLDTRRFAFHVAIENWGHEDLVKKYIQGAQTAVDYGPNGNIGVIGWYMPVSL